jgi:ABC-type phosphate transport system permease subunit
VDDEAVLYDEIVGSKHDLESITDRPIRYFAFPYGMQANLSQAGFRLAFQAGYWGVCSAYGGYNSPGDDAFHIHRLHADPKWSRFCNWMTADPQLRRGVKPVLELLAGVPTVVYGYFALLFVTPALQGIFPNLTTFNALSPGIVMGIMILPLVSSLSEDAMRAVPNGLREGSYALGATRMQTSLRVIVPAAFSGITAACILAVSRAVGETMIVAIAAGQQPRLTFDPKVPIETMTAYIVQVSLGDTPQGTLEYRTIFAVGMLLFLGTFGLNLVSAWLRQRYREEYA